MSEHESAARGALLLADTHVHVHRCFDDEAVLAAAARNFAEAAARLAPNAALQGVLCLTEMAGVDRFAVLRAAAQRAERRGPWTLRATAEPSSVAALGDAGATLFVIAGRQIVTRERLEVLALGAAAACADGQSLETTLAAVLDAGAAAVLPWGVGKWRGLRGALVDSLIARSGRPLHLGDNGNRLEWGAVPAQFVAARRAGLRILPGSDPLPLRGEERRIGGYGVCAAARLDPDRPAAGLLALFASRAELVTYGRRERLARFMRNQLAMQLAKRRAA
jgi:hypothetical protein